MTPRSVQMNFGVQREVAKGAVLSVDFVRNVLTRYLLGVDTNHVGDARYLSVDNALAAINATLAGTGCPAATSAGASSQAAVDCYLAANPAAAMPDFAGNGLDSGAVFSGGGPGTAAFGGINPAVGVNEMLFPSGRSVYNALQVAWRQNIANPAPGVRGLNLQVAYSLSRFEDNIGGNTAAESLGDQDFALAAVDFRNPGHYFGPSAQDRTHQLSFGAIVDFSHQFAPGRRAMCCPAPIWGHSGAASVPIA
jgi:hypothetical protein